MLKGNENLSGASSSFKVCEVKFYNFSNLQVYGMCLLKLLQLCKMLKEVSKDNGLLIPLKLAA